jgi:hypothetical protein
MTKKQNQKVLLLADNAASHCVTEKCDNEISSTKSNI